MLRQVYGNTVSIFIRAEVPFECVDLLGVVFFSRRRLFVCYIRPSKMQEKKKKTTVTMNPLVNRRLSSISPVFHGLFRILCTGCPILALCKAGRALTAHKYCSTAIPLIYSSSFIFILDYCFSYPVMKRVSFSSPHFMSHLHSLSC